MLNSFSKKFRKSGHITLIISHDTEQKMHRLIIDVMFTCKTPMSNVPAVGSYHLKT